MKKLQDQAEKIIRHFDLENFLSKFGKTHLVGNIALGTTVKPDIDFQIYSEPNVWAENSKNIIEYFQSFGLNDYITRDLKESGKYLTSIAYLDEDGVRWTIDITQTLPNTDYLKDAYRFYVDYKDKLTPENQKTILKLKQYFFDKEMLHHSMSFYIYTAVLDHHAKTVSDIYDYLKEHKVYLGKFKDKR